MLGHLVERQRAGGGRPRSSRRSSTPGSGVDVRAGGDDDVLGLERLLGAVLGRHLDLARRRRCVAGADEGVDLVLLEQEADAVDVGVDRVVLVLHHRGEIELRRADLDAEGGEVVARLVEQLGGMQQRLGRDAADVEAGAAKRLALLDDGHLEPELRGPDGADIAAGAGADDDEVVGHE